MTSTTHTNGRLCNQVIRNLAISFIAKKHDLNVIYSSHEMIRMIGIELYNGNNSYNETRILTDDNYFSVYNSDNICYNLDPNNDYFQTKEIIDIIYKYLNSSNIKSRIIGMNRYKDRYNTNNDLYVHIRLTDAKKYAPKISYYLDQIKRIKYDNLYISTDNPNDEYIQKILSLYPSTRIIQTDEVNTIQFASTCKHIILSGGSFSAFIGYIAFYSDVYYPEYQQDKIWHGDMFSIPHWNKCPSK